jgi:hypothetical protein
MWQGNATFDEYDLRLMSSVDDVGGIPKAGKSRIIVAEVKDALHFRIFDSNGRRIADTDETKLTTQAKPIDELRKQLGSLWPPHDLIKSEKTQFIVDVTSILERFTVVLHTLDAHSRGTPLYPPFVRGGKETGRSVSVLPPYEGGIQGGEFAATQGCATQSLRALGHASFDLSAPILDFTIKESLQDGFVKEAWEVLRFWIEEVDQENLRRMKAGVLNFQMPARYTTRERPNGGGVVQGVTTAKRAAIDRAVASLKEPLHWLTDQLFKVEDFSSGIRSMLLFRHLFPNEFRDLRALGSHLNTLNTLLGRNEPRSQSEGVDDLGSLLDQAIGEHGGEQTRGST